MRRVYIAYTLVEQQRIEEQRAKATFQDAGATGQ